jgi:GNAT superfamily N-acetyltransferase
VQRDRWGQGIGSRLYDHLLPRAKEIQAKKLYVWIRDGEQHVLDFVLHRGYTLTPRSHRLSRLNVHTANLEGFEGVEERLRREGIDICTVADVGVENEEFLRRLHAMSDETIRDVPSSEQFGDTPFELFLEDLRAPGNSPEWMWVAMDGERPVGLAFLRVMDGSALNEYTATDRAYRGRGIARALKLKTIEWCRANGIESIYTGNDIDNQRMLAINIRLGYEMLPPFREVVKELS